MLLSDRDIRAAVEDGSFAIEPYEPGLVQPSSVDIRLDRYMRVFNNSRYTHIDPNLEMPELTTLVEVDEGDSFVLHPGEFILGSTLERIVRRYQGRPLAGVLLMTDGSATDAAAVERRITAGTHAVDTPVAAATTVQPESGSEN